MDIRFRCAAKDFLPQQPCDARVITADAWREHGKRWGLYADWGPQRENIEQIAAKGEQIVVVFENEKAVAAAGRLPRSVQEDEVDSVLGSGGSTGERPWAADCGGRDEGDH